MYVLSEVILNLGENLSTKAIFDTLNRQPEVFSSQRPLNASAILYLLGFEMSITLFFPGLSEDVIQETQFVKKAVVSKHLAQSPKALLSDLMQKAEHQFSYFNSLYRYFNNISNPLAVPSRYLVMTPCHLAADLKTLHLQAVSPLQATEIDQIKVDVEDFLKQDGLTIDGIGETHWLIHWPETIDYQQKSIMEFGLGPLTGDEADGGDKAKVNRLQSELQMLLHQHPINQQRNVNRILPVNAFWIWRDRVQMEIGACPYDVVVGDEAILGASSVEENQAMPPPNLELLESGLLRHFIQNSQKATTALVNSKKALVGSHQLLSTQEPSWLGELPGFIDATVSTLFKEHGRTVTLITHEKSYCLRPWYRRWLVWKK